MISIEYFRQFKILHYAVFDFAVSFIVVAILAPLLSRLFLMLRIVVPKKNWLYLTLPVSIVVHVLVGTYTPMTQQFLDISGYYILKIVIIILTIMGLRGIHRKKL